MNDTANRETPREEPAFDLNAFDEERIYTIHPAMFGWIVLVFTFLTYQLIGGIAAYLVTGGDAAGHITGTRLLTMVSQVLFLLAPALVMVKMQPWTYKRLLYLEPARPSQLLLAIFAVAALQIPMQAFVQFQQHALETWVLPEQWLPFLEKFEQSLTEMYGTIATAHSPAELLFVILVVAITPAVCEELLFRGVVLGSFMRGMGTAAAIGVSGIVFALFHLNPVTFVPLAALGVVLAYFTWKSGSILPAMAAHVANNTIAIISLYFLEGVDPAFTADGSAMPGSVLAVVAALSLAVFIAVLGMFRAVSRPIKQ